MTAPRILILSVLGLASCAWYERALERLRHDGTMACAAMYSTVSRAHPMDIFCRYYREEGACECWTETGARFDRPLLPAFPPTTTFCVDFTETLPGGLSWPHPRWYEELARLRDQIAREIEVASLDGGASK